MKGEGHCKPALVVGVYKFQGRNGIIPLACEWTTRYNNWGIFCCFELYTQIQVEIPKLSVETWANEMVSCKTLPKTDGLLIEMGAIHKGKWFLACR